MESCNSIAWLLALAYALLSLEFFPCVIYISKHPACLADLIMLGIMGTMGQCFVYYTVTNFSPFYLSVITTTRKFFTVIASILVFGHQVTGSQWLSIGFVFFGVGMEIYEGKKKHSAAALRSKKEDPPIENDLVEQKRDKDTFSTASTSDGESERLIQQP